MNSTIAILVFDALLLLVLIGMLAHHIRQNKHARKKTEQITQELYNEREKTEKFHVSIEEIMRLTKREE